MLINNLEDPKHRSNDDYLRTAWQNAVELSTDPSTQNGAILVAKVPPQSPICTVQVEDANRFPDGVKETKERWTRPLKYFCVEHAERNAIYKAAKQGVATEGATMYVAWAACADCARAIIQAGIKKVVTHHNPLADTRFGQPVSDVWKDSVRIGMQMLEEAGIDVYYSETKLFPNDELKVLYNGALISP